MKMNKADFIKELSGIGGEQTSVIQIGEQQLDCKIKPFLTPSEQSACVNDVTQAIMVDGVRDYALVDYAFRVAMVRFFTDVNYAFTEKQWATLVYGTTIIAAIRSVADGAVAILQTACKEKIKAEYKMELAVIETFAKPDPLDRIATAVESVTGGIKELISGMSVDDLKAALGGAGLDNNNLIHGLFGGEDKNDGQEDTAEPADVSGADEADKS